nr:MAG TPA: hypothetical protein [Caudoviricetes sp.]
MFCDFRHKKCPPGINFLFKYRKVCYTLPVFNLPKLS